jgi:hypothetical protein
LGDIYGSVDWSHQWKRCQRGQTWALPTGGGSTKDVF